MAEEVHLEDLLNLLPTALLSPLTTPVSHCSPAGKNRTKRWSGGGAGGGRKSEVAFH